VGFFGLILFLASQVARVGVDFLLAIWAEQGAGMLSEVAIYYYACMVLLVVLVLFRFTSLNMIMVRIGRNMHSMVFRHVLAAPIPGMLCPPLPPCPPVPPLSPLLSLGSRAMAPLDSTQSSTHTTLTDTVPDF
jgi:hypothetical protein